MPIPENGLDKVRFVQAHGDELTSLEQQYGVQQAIVVDEMIEESCWRESALLKAFLGDVGTAQERRTALLAALLAENN